MQKKAGGGTWIIIILIIAALAATIYFTFFFYYKCPNNDVACYLAHQEKCARTKFINDKEESTLSYKIKGKNSGNCEIDVTVLSVKQGSAEKISLENKNMICSLLIGSRRYPEEDLSKCHGILKEELQGIMLQNAHAYIINNVGIVGEELNNILSNPIQVVKNTTGNSSG